jgi:SAM-dependent methyltransferase
MSMMTLIILVLVAVAAMAGYRLVSLTRFALNNKVILQNRNHEPLNLKHVCPVCQGECTLLDVVDMNKSCEEVRGKFFKLSGIPVYYALCGSCGFCFAPEISNWSLEEFEEKIYNAEYSLVDPDYIESRPKDNARNLISMFGDKAHTLKHLDYGGGGGLLASLLNKSNWQSLSYDPFVDIHVDIEQLGKFDLISAFEVFEHVPDMKGLMKNMHTLLAPGGIVLFSTLLSDGNIMANQRINWWYAAPRNGHISLYSKKSLAILAQDNGLNVGSISDGFYIFYTKIPVWASHIMIKSI